VPKRQPGKPLGPLARRRLAEAGLLEAPPKRKQSVFGKPLVLVYALGLLLVGVVWLQVSGGDSVTSFLGSFGAPMSALEDPTRTRVLALSPRDIRQMARQREIVDGLARRHTGRSPTGSLLDLETLQEIVKNRLIAADRKYELQALGVVLGDVIVKQQRDVRWVSVEDRYGHSHALQVGDGNDFIFPVTMISKRIELGRAVYVEDLYDSTVASIRRIRGRS
jgi:hypothetical protein